MKDTQVWALSQLSLHVGMHRFSAQSEESAYALKDIAFCIFTVIPQLAHA